MRTAILPATMIAALTALPAVAATDVRGAGAPPVVTVPLVAPAMTKPVAMTPIARVAPPVRVLPVRALPVQAVAMQPVLVQSAQAQMMQPPMLPPMERADAGYGRAPIDSMHYGYRLAPTFQRDEYFIGDYRAMGLREPAPGFGWSRYGDAAVLTDQWGRVYDWQTRVDWRRMRMGQGYRSHWQGDVVQGYGRGGYDQRYQGGYDQGYQGGYVASSCNTGCGDVVYEQVVAGPPVVTTTTHTYYETVYDRVAKPVRRYAPVRKRVARARPAPKCVIGS